MFKVKNIAVAAACGFLLSFLICIISTHRFGVALLRGLIFGLIFAALGFAIDMLNSKFLEVDGGLVGDSVDDGSKKPSSGSSSGAGSFVNITIDDENLTEEDQAPAFDVSSGRQVFSYKTEPKVTASAPVEPVAAAESAPVSAPATVSKETAGTAEFKPVQLGTPIESGETVKNDPPQAQETDSAKKGSGVKEIDALPDIGEFSNQDDGAGGDGGSVASVISDSEFAQSGDMKASAAMTEGGDMMKQDSKIIASAIRTLLKKED
ncbi:MAG: hypothetical protein MJZ80_10270 [Treponema sp.]|nr:hypothetical protein [Treponema sp.]